VRNLAGSPNADYYVKRELHIADIQAWEAPEVATGEVATKFYGILPGFRFVRVWSYWIATGRVPIKTAWALYADPAGKDIRVDGHCMCPAPRAPWTQWYTPDNKQVFPKDQEAEYLHYMEKLDMKPDPNWVFSDDPLSLGAQEFVTCYHIDSEVGLRVFADAVRS